MKEEDQTLNFEQRSRALAEQLSEDLKDDIELQLDVREELHCHLLDAYDMALDRWDTEEEAAEHSLEEFGPTAELPQLIVQGNLTRMHLRTRVKWLLTYAFVPLVILLALGLGYREWKEAGWFRGRSADSHLPEETLSSQVQAKIGQKEFPGLFKQFEKENPHNGFVDMMWICDHLSHSFESQTEQMKSPEDLKILLKRFETMTRKQKYNSLRSDSLKEKLTALDSVYRPSLLQSTAKIGHTAAMIVPELSAQRRMIKILVQEAALKFQQGKQHEGEKIILQISDFLEALTYNKDQFLINELVNLSMATLVIKNEKLKPFLETSPQLKTIHKRFQKLSELQEKLKSSGKGLGLSEEQKQEFLQILTERSGLLAEMTAPALERFYTKVPDEDIFTKSRQVEYTLLSKNIFFLTSTALFTLIVFCLLMICVLHFCKKEQKPFLLLPALSKLFTHLLLSVFLPLFIYEFYKLLPFSSHAWNLQHSKFYFIGEMLFLAIIMPSLSLFFWQKQSQQRLLNLGMNKNRTKQPLLTAFYSLSVFGIILAFLGSILLLDEQSFRIIRKIVFYQADVLFVHNDFEGIQLLDFNLKELFATREIFIPYLFFATLAFSLLLLFIHGLRKKNRDLRSCLLHSLLFYSSCVLVIISLYSAVFLRAQEIHYIKTDILFKPSASGLTSLETQAVDNIRKEMKKLWPEG